jgi:hypothetical protein
MRHKLLDYLLNDEFADAVGFILPPSGFRLVLRRSDAVRRLTFAIRRGEVTEPMVRSFVSRIARSAGDGTGQIPGDLALAALAVALENIQQDYAEEFITNLAKLRIAGLATAIRVAKECLRYRLNFPKNQVRALIYSKQASAINYVRVSARPPASKNTSTPSQGRKVRFYTRHSASVRKVANLTGKLIKRTSLHRLSRTELNLLRRHSELV